MKKRIEDEALEELLEKIRGNNIDSIDLGYNVIISIPDAIAILESIVDNQSVTSLSLRHNQNGSSMIESIIKIIKHNKHITNLDISGNFLGLREGRMNPLSEALKSNIYITKLDLSCNHLGEEGIRLLAEVLKENKVVLNVDFTGNRMTEKGIEYLASSFEVNKHLHTLNLCGEKISDEGMLILTKALKINKSITHLMFYGAQMTLKAESLIVEMIMENYHLTKVDIELKNKNMKGIIDISISRNILVKKTVEKLYEGKKLSSPELKIIANFYKDISILDDKLFFLSKYLIKDNEAGFAPVKLEQKLKLDIFSDPSFATEIMKYLTVSDTANFLLAGDAKIAPQYIHQLQHHTRIVQGFTTMDVPADGNCFYHAIAAGLTNHGFSNINYLNVREFAINYIMGNSDSFLEFVPDGEIDNYIDTHSRQGEWADNLMIQAVSSLANINIYIHPTNGFLDYMVHPQSGPVSRERTINLGYDGVHYFLLIPNLVSQEIENPPIFDNVMHRIDENQVYHEELEANHDLGICGECMKYSVVAMAALFCNYIWDSL